MQQAVSKQAHQNLDVVNTTIAEKSNIPVEKQYQIYWSENGQNVANKVIVEYNIMKISSEISFFDFVRGSFTDKFVAEKI